MPHQIAWIYAAGGGLCVGFVLGALFVIAYAHYFGPEKN
jgi:hypothetical protein